MKVTTLNPQRSCRSLGMLMFFSLLLGALAPGSVRAASANPMQDDITQGALRVKTASGVVECPLKHTDVKATISGFVSRVTVTQGFYNPYDEKIEAVYVFPLPHTAAVDTMSMTVGARKIVGVMQRRDEARATYARAMAAGKTASLLEQERPNIFTQSLGNIPPKQAVQIEISYVESLKYDMGSYEFTFPMVVGPRYIPGAPLATKSNPAGRAPDTAAVPDGSKITPPLLQPGERCGQDISLSVQLQAGVPIQEINVATHQTTLERHGGNDAKIVLSNSDAIPNKDFTLRYRVAGAQPQMALLTHSKGSGNGYFMLMIQPAKSTAEQAPPREMVFLVDVSGSMCGLPTEKVKATLGEFFKRCRPDDTMQVVLFASKTAKVFPAPVSCTPDNATKALQAIDDYNGGGGTELLAGVQAVLNAPSDPQRVRIAVMLTDGYIGNEEEILKAVKEHSGDKIRFWTIGIGSAPNRYLLDGVAKLGGGMSEVIELNTAPAPVVAKMVERIQSAQLEHIHIDWNGLQVSDVYPKELPALWADQPLILHGRYFESGQAKITVHGVSGGKEVSWPLDVNLSADANPESEALSSVWARKKIDDLSEQMLSGNQAALRESITKLALDYRIMSKYTSFVAVDESQLAAPSATPPKRVDVAVPLPAGMNAPTSTPATPVSLMPAATFASPAAAPGPPGPAGATGATGEAAALSLDDTDALSSADGRVVAFKSIHGASTAGRAHAMVASGSVTYAETDAAVTSTKDIGGGGGDPWIRVTAPADATQVVAIFPGGNVQSLAFNRKSGAWMGRFDFPFGTAAGLYRVSIIVVHRDGARSSYTLEYHNRLSADIHAAGGSLCASAGAPVTVQVSGEGVRRAVVLTPWCERRTMTGGEDNLHAEVTVPAHWPAGTHHLTVLLLDGAHNRTEISIDLQVREGGK